MSVSVLDQATLRSLVYYDPESGLFTWLKRPGTERVTKIFNSQFSGKRVVGFIGRDGYRYIDLAANGERFRQGAHRLAWLYCYGELPELMFELDHINRVKTDNRICNLRLSTKTMNRHNYLAHVRSKSGARGIYLDKARNKWAAEITTDGKRIRLGRFDTFAEAQAAYADASLKYAKEFSIFSEVAA